MLKKSTFFILLLIAVSIFSLTADTLEEEMAKAGLIVFRRKSKFN